MDATAEAAFREFVAACGSRLLRTAYLLTGDRGHAEDLVQLALERTACRWSGLAGSPEAFARTVLLHAATDRWRRRRARVQEVFDAVYEPGVADGTDELLLRRDLIAALRQLPPRQRAVLVLRYFLDLSETETARELDVSVGTVKSTASRALDRLRTLVPVDLTLVPADLNQEAHR
jgi:RNA polymerase sigma-70 factor (sigma-E family)